MKEKKEGKLVRHFCGIQTFFLPNTLSSIAVCLCPIKCEQGNSLVADESHHVTTRNQAFG